MRALPAELLTVAVALGLSSGCAAAPSPAASTAAQAGDTLLVAWVLRAEAAELWAVDPTREGETMPLPEAPNGAVSGDPRGRLAFVAGPPASPVLWTAEFPLAGEAGWESTRLIPPAAPEDRLRWVCLGPEDLARVAVQSNDTSVFLVEADARLLLLPRPHGLFRPGGCAWLDDAHVLVPLDIPTPPSRIAFGLIGIDDGATAVLAGGGEDPTVAGGRLAHAWREGTRSVVLVRPVPHPDGPLPDPIVRIAAEGGGDLYRPVLSAEGTRLAVFERDALGRPAELLVYDLLGEAKLLLRLDVSDTDDAGPAWVADVR